MSLGVRYTRGFLLDLKRRLSFVRDAHELLEMKRDQLIREIRNAIAKLEEIRGEVEEEVEELYRDLALIHATYGSQELLSASWIPGEKMELEILPRIVMGVEVPELKIVKAPSIGKDCPPHIIGLARKASNLIIKLLKLAELEAMIERIAEDLRMTNVRVNALEKVVIPTYEELIKRIGETIDQSQLEEFMRVKLVKKALARRRGAV